MYATKIRLVSLSVDFDVAARGPKLRECCTTETKINLNMT